MPVEMMPDSFPSLFGAYTVIWILLCFYILSLGRKVSSLQREIERNTTEKKSE